MIGCFLENYNSLPDSELREEFAKNQTTKDFELSIGRALSNKTDFCYETNFFESGWFCKKKKGLHIRCFCGYLKTGVNNIRQTILIKECLQNLQKMVQSIPILRINDKFYLK